MTADAALNEWLARVPAACPACKQPIAVAPDGRCCKCGHALRLALRQQPQAAWYLGLTALGLSAGLLSLPLTAIVFAGILDLFDSQIGTSFTSTGLWEFAMWFGIAVCPWTLLILWVRLKRILQRKRMVIRWTLAIIVSMPISYVLAMATLELFR